MNNDKTLEQVIAERQGILDNICRVIIENRTPPSYQIAIGGACRFHYHDAEGNPAGHHDDFHDRTDVPAGSDLEFQSNNGCVKYVRVVMVAYSPIHGRAEYTIQSNGAPAGRCAIECKWVYGPQSNVALGTPFADAFHLVEV